jgi:hypothetical protein
MQLGSREKSHAGAQNEEEPLREFINTFRSPEIQLIRFFFGVESNEQRSGSGVEAKAGGAREWISIDEMRVLRVLEGSRTIFTRKNEFLFC